MGMKKKEKHQRLDYIRVYVYACNVDHSRLGFLVTDVDKMIFILLWYATFSNIISDQQSS